VKACFDCCFRSVLRLERRHTCEKNRPAMKRKPLPPRRKRMKRQARLASARTWLAKFSGKNVVRGYANWFGVDLLCAVKELSLCGVAIDPAYVAQLTATIASRSCRRAKKSIAESQSLDYGVEWDEQFAYIAGQTAAGFPYGVTWEELASESSNAEQVKSPSDDDYDDDLPF